MRATCVMCIMCILCVLCIGVPVRSFAQAEVEPIRCWWQSSAGAITVGQSFDVTLTCAVLDTESVQVVPDESRLNIASVQMTPFEIIGGDHPADTHSGARRFLQYRYALRTLDRDLIGHDINIQQLPISYRVHSKMGGDAALEGRDLTYLLPAIPLKVLSLVPQEATDIRDGGRASLATVESLRFRSSAFQLLAVTLGIVAIVLVGWALVPLVRGAEAVTVDKPGQLPPRLILSKAISELSESQAAASGGWNDELITRALGALRIVAACAIGQPVGQRVLAMGAPVPEGRLLVERGWPLLRAWRFGGQAASRVTVSSPVTADDVSRAIKALPPTATETERIQLVGLRDGLRAFTSAIYPRDPVRDAGPLDDAVRHALSIAPTVALRASAGKPVR